MNEPVLGVSLSLSVLYLRLPAAAWCISHSWQWLERPAHSCSFTCLARYMGQVFLENADRSLPAFDQLTIKNGKGHSALSSVGELKAAYLKGDVTRI